MPNRPARNTVTASFTLPRELFAALKNEAIREMTNQSNIIRRALMKYLSPEERAVVERERSARIAEKPSSPYGSAKRKSRRKHSSLGE
jgi:metal-responsive CopG/Arc/MetJ family transcriptional regulator